MGGQTIFRKTEKGNEAIGARAHGVSGKLRTLLILVDGKKTSEELLRLAQGLGESDDLLEQLQSQALIEAVSSAESASSPGSVASGSVNLSQLKSLAARLLNEQLGPVADELGMKIEASKDLADFIEIVKRAYGVLRDVKGKAVADQFGAEIEARMK